MGRTDHELDFELDHDLDLELDPELDLDLDLDPPNLKIASIAFMAFFAGVAACSAITSFDDLIGADAGAGDASSDARADGSDGAASDGGVGDAATEAAVSFPDGSVLFGGHAYMIVVTANPISWDDARAAATDAGGHLATITSDAENTFTTNLLMSTPTATTTDGIGPFLGGYQPMPTPDQEPDGGWAWITGEPWSYTAWGDMQPDNSGGTENYLNYYFGGWNDIDDFDDSVESYMIEFE